METKRNVKTGPSVPSSTYPILGTAIPSDKEGYFIVKNRAFIGQIYTIICPKCQKPILSKALPSGKPTVATCKVCGTKVVFRGKETTPQAEPQHQSVLEETATTEQRTSTQKYRPVSTETGGTIKLGKPNAKLVWGNIFKKKEYVFNRTGEHYIGRDDDEVLSDVAIHDEFVSRRSVVINAIPKDGTMDCGYKLTVKNATNPVLVNGQPMEIRESTYLNYGDTILLGNTTITFKKNK